MSEEDSPDLTKSWVFVDPEKRPSEDAPGATSGVEEVSEHDSAHVDSDTDSISVISESGCSYKTDEEEFAPAIEEDTPVPVAEPETPPPEPVKLPEVPHENQAVEKLRYFATSAACALVLVCFSIFVQYYLFAPSDVNKFIADVEQPVTPFVQSIKSRGDSGGVVVKKSYSFRRKNKGNGIHDRIASPSAQIENNDLTVEDVRSNYKLSKNKSPTTKFNKENCDDSDKRARNDDFDEPNKDNKRLKKYEKTSTDREQQKDETMHKKIKEIEMKEAYLREKEKFLIEKEHDLMKKEIKLTKEKNNYGKNKYDKKPKKDKETKYNSEEHNSKEKKDKFKAQKEYHEDKKMTKKMKNKENKKRYYDQNKIIDEGLHKKRNMSGQWYIDLHKARNNIRQKEHASDWVFDRAHLRSLKRNKAHWYFQWMVDRARLRVK